MHQPLLKNMAASSEDINPSLFISAPDPEPLPEYKEDPVTTGHSDGILPISSIPTVRFQILDSDDAQQVRSLCEMWSDAFQDKREHWCQSREQDIGQCLEAIQKYKANHRDKLNGFCVAIERDESRGTEEVIGGISVTLHGQMGDIRMPESIRHKCRSGEAYIDWVGVHANARGKGIGKGLLQFSENYAAAHHCSVLALEVVNGNRARNLYERRGFEVVKNPDNAGCPDCCLKCMVWVLTGYCGAFLMHKQLSNV